MEARWTLRAVQDVDRVRQLKEEIHVPEVIASILVSRDIDSYEKAKAYFRPSLADLHNPFLMHDMEKAVSRIVQGQASGEKMLVYGDYDVDGTNSASSMFMFLRQIECNVEVYIPDRMTEGYGISETGIDYARSRDITLIIAIDCGITAVSQVEYARKHNIDVIICDHHEPAETTPDAYAVLDPLKPEDTYPFKYLSGCGVGFKLMQGLAEYYDVREMPYEYLDFVAIAAAADIVPLIGENRILVYFGLRLLNERPRPGIKALIESSGLSFGDLTAGQIVFVMAPRINAVGRLGDAHRAVDLLTCQDEAVATEYALILEEENRNRRKIDEDTFNQAQVYADRILAESVDAPIVLHNEDWHPGVLGIVASRLVERYYRPSIMLSTVDGVAKGSARSIIGFNIYEALKRCEHTLVQFGGHKYAAGLALEVDRIDEFRECFTAVAREMYTSDILTPEIKIDACIEFSDITARFFRVLKQFAPFGPGNQRPVFVTRKAEVYGEPRIVGRNHLKLKLRNAGVVFDAIGFNLGDKLPVVRESKSNLDVVFTIEENTWNGNTFPQLKLKDLRKGTDEELPVEVIDFSEEILKT